jgi:hypothetical protein
MHEVQFKEFPAEFYVGITGEDFHEGRITIMKTGSSYSSQIDIVVRENKKIFKHIDMKYGYGDPHDLLNQSMQSLSHFLNPAFR